MPALPWRLRRLAIDRYQGPIDASSIVGCDDRDPTRALRRIDGACIGRTARHAGATRRSARALRSPSLPISTPEAA
jgi:hypothetical protein